MAGVWNRAIGVIAVSVILLGGACSSDGNDRAAKSTKKTEPTVLGSEVTRSSTTTTQGATTGPPAPSTTSTSTTATTGSTTTTTARAVTQTTTRTPSTTRTQTSTVTTTCPSGGIGWRASIAATGGQGNDSWTLHLTGTLTNGANGTVRVSSVSVNVNYSPPAGEQQANPVFTFAPSPTDIPSGGSVDFDQTKTVHSTTKPTIASLDAAASWADPSVPSSCPPPKTS